MQRKRAVCNLLVTGGAGFIGSAFIRSFLKTNFRGTIVNLDALTYAGNLENLKEVEQDPRYRFIHGTICCKKTIARLIYEYEIDTIIHFAAESHVDRSIESPNSFIETNIVGTFTLLEAIRANPNIHFHHVSTDEVYGSLGKKGIFTETSPYQPSSPYSASKAASDHLVRAYHHTYGLSCTLSNCSNNFGAYQYPEKLIPKVILNALSNTPIPLYGNGENVRDWLFVDDHARALETLLSFGESGETYNIGGDCEKSNKELILEIFSALEQMGYAKKETLLPLITPVEDRPGHDLRYAIDSSKIKNAFGWRPKHTFEEALRETIRFFATQVAKTQDPSSLQKSSPFSR